MKLSATIPVWRPRLKNIACVFDDLQRDCELFIGLKGRRTYKKQFFFIADCKEDAELLMMLFKKMCLDCTRIVSRPDTQSFGEIVMGVIEGKRPKLKGKKT